MLNKSDNFVIINEKEIANIIADTFAKKSKISNSERIRINDKFKTSELENVMKKCIAPNLDGIHHKIILVFFGITCLLKILNVM